ncbi:E3 ubiquitin ligase RBr family protein [Fadolivirus algeromassiliense]|jgi:E3 ubiquitin-protein ligase RNF144|uniref:RBR-type E3 ubiquitin transferase n=1 Tax=Fadolivirus FV1/VV64 TaxID=3070911 RepID=A0A7D3UQU8_9VIRU|nr:E3 ubiquitin ligase RBr family protein [Fadolivirus algeromassiliense]QKF94728.1 E3 ubiquitin ligase RBr family protein [Fadolivirus FV1/VV64]
MEDIDFEHLISGIDKIVQPISSHKHDQKKIKELEKQHQETKKAIIDKITKPKIQKTVECLICLEKVKKSSIISINDCNHGYCNDCISMYIETAVNSKNTEIKCPDPTCKIMISHEFLQKHLSAEMFEKHESNQMDILVAKSNDMTYCPKNNCSKVCLKDSRSTKTNCVACGLQFCFVCKLDYNDTHRCNYDSIMEKLNKEIADTYPDKSKVKPCPVCFNVIEKGGGCDGITCNSCRTWFCWNCMMTDEQTRKMGHDCRKFTGNNAENQTDVKQEEKMNTNDYDYETSDDEISDDDSSSY